MSPVRRWAPALRALAWLIERPVAHRGLHDVGSGIVENTMSAFSAAVRHGYAIECDLQISADGEAMVFHDSTLDRLTQGCGRLDRMTAAELEQVPFRSTADRMPRLSQLLSEVAGRVPLVIELKSRWDGSTALVRRSIEVLRGYSGPFALMSFDPDIVAAVREIAPAVVRGIVADRVTEPGYAALDVARRLELRYLRHLDRSRPHFLAYDVDGLPSAAARAFRQAGLPVICWTVTGADMASRARRYADQITFEGFLA